MRKIGLGLAMLALLVSSVMAQPELLWTADISVQGEDDFTAYSVIETSDGGFLLAGYGYEGAQVVKTDGFGNIQWDLSYGDGNGFEYFFDVVEAADGFFYTSGQFFNGGLSLYLDLIAKINPNGSFEFVQVIDNAGRQNAECIEVDADGFIWVGGYWSADGFEEYGSLIKLDTNLNQLGFHIITSCERITDIKLMDDQIIAVGYENTFDIEIHPWMGAVSYDGVALWDTWGTLDAIDGGFSTVAISPDQTTATASGHDFSMDQIPVVQFNTDGSGQVYSQFMDFSPSADAARKIIAGNGASETYYILVQGTQSGGGGAAVSHMVKIDDQGQTIWEAEFGGQVYEYPSSMVLLGEDDLVYSGVYSTNSFLKHVAPLTGFDVTLTPNNEPVQIGPNGGYINMHGSISNLGSEYLAMDVWVVVEHLLIQAVTTQTFSNVPFNGGQTRQANLSQGIPPWAPSGDYLMHLKIGHLPNDVLGEASFPFTKTGPKPNGGLSAFTNPDAWPVIGSFDHAAAIFTADANQQTAQLSEFTLGAAYPNPFNPTTSFSVQLPESANLQVTVHDITGRLVATLANGSVNAGAHTFTFDGSGLASGVYFVHAASGAQAATQKLVLMK